jgi:predicted component of type VI protein secretion system
MPTALASTSAHVESTRAAAASLLAAAALDNPVPAGPRLVVMSGPDAGAVLRVGDGSVLGRGRRADLPLSDGRASRRHACFTFQGGRALLRGLGALNGLTVNGRRVRPGRAVTLAPGDVIAVGTSVLAFEDGLSLPGAAQDPARAAASPPSRAAAGHRRGTALAAAGLVASAVALAFAALAA